jgi:hypothetical protein
MKKTLLFLLGTSCFGLNAQVTAFPPDPIDLCDFFTPNDGIEVFDLTIREGQIIGGQSNVNVTFHLSSGDALGGQNPFPNPEMYTNIVNPQLIFVRVQSTAGQGNQITTLDIMVLPVANVENDPNDLFVDDGNGDGIGVFDLTVNTAVMLGSQNPNDLDIAFYTSETDAIAKLNEVSVPTSYVNTSNPQTIYVRFERLDNGCFTVPTFEIEADEFLGIDENELSYLKLYPNPTTDLVNISSQDFSSEIQLAVFNISGQQVYSKIRTPQSNHVVLDISSLDSGLYFLQIASEGNRITKKLIKK